MEHSWCCYLLPHKSSALLSLFPIVLFTLHRFGWNPHFIISCSTMCKVLNFFDVIYYMRYLISMQCALSIYLFLVAFIHSLTIFLSILSRVRPFSSCRIIHSQGINYMLFCLLIRRQSTAIYLQQISHALGYNSIWLNTILE